MLDSDASTAKTLTLVAIILQLVFFFIGILGVIGLAALVGFASSISASSSSGSTVNTFPSVGFGIVFFVLSGFFLIGLLWLLMDYFLVYRRLDSGRVREAETPSLLLGILQLLFGGVITGILLIIAYVKIGDSLRRNQQA